MTDDDDARRAELARQGIARLGVMRMGARLGYAPTNEELLPRVLDELAAVRKQLAEVAEFRKRLEAVEAAQAAIKPALQEGARKTVKTLRSRRLSFVQKVDKELGKSDEVTLTAAVRAVVKRSVSEWDTLSPPQRKRLTDNGTKRYHREKKP